MKTIFQGVRLADLPQTPCVVCLLPCWLGSDADLIIAAGDGLVVCTPCAPTLRGLVLDVALNDATAAEVGAALREAVRRRDKQ